MRPAQTVSLNASELIAAVRPLVGQLAGTSGAIDHGFNVAALQLFTLQFERNPVYRHFCEARQLSPENVARWKEIPALPVGAFKEFDVTCLSPDERSAVFHSSGTTQQSPGRHFHSTQSLALYESSLLPWFKVHLLRHADASFNRDESRVSEADAADCPELMILTPPAHQIPQSSLAYMFETIRREWWPSASGFYGSAGAAGEWGLESEKIVASLERCIDIERPVMLLGTAFNFVHLLDDLAAKGLRYSLPPGSRLMETGGYKGRSRVIPQSSLHSLITHHLGIPSSAIVCEYGMCELGSQAYDGVVHRHTESRDGDRGFRFPPWVRVVLISPETGEEVSDGETGLIRIFDLANAYSVLAIQTEDLAIRRADAFEWVGRAAPAESRGCSLMTL